MKKNLFTQYAKRGFALALAIIVTFTLGTMNSLFAYSVDTSGEAEEVSLAGISAIDNQYYRNLNLTPGGGVDEMRFVWHSQSEVGSVRIYEAGSDTLVQEVNSATQVLTARSEDTVWFPGVTPDYTVHHVMVENLLPSTNYEYVIVGEDFVSSRKSFRTGGDSSFSFFAVGDPQVGTYVQEYHVTREKWQSAMNVMADQVPNASFLLSAGDQVHSNRFNVDGTLTSQRPYTREQQFVRSQYMHDMFFSPTQFHSLPLVPVAGNHEHGSDNTNSVLWSLNYGTANPASSGMIYRNTRRLGNGGFQSDYYVRWGNTLIIQLYSTLRTQLPAFTLTPGSPRYDWLVDVLERHSDATWRIAAFHHPPYSAYRATTLIEKVQLIDFWLPALERHDFDMVLTGHCHAYSRTHQMVNNVPVVDQQWIDEDGNVNYGSDVTNAVLNPTGIVYFALGSATSSAFYNLAAVDARDYIAVYNQNFMRNFSVVDVTANTLSIATYQINNDETTTLVDVYTIVRSENDEVPYGVITQQMGDTQWGTFRSADIANVYVLETGTPLEEIELPAQINVFTDIRNNYDGLPSAIRSPSTSDYNRSVRPLRADVIWDVEAATAAFEPNGMYQVYTIPGRIVGVAGGYVYITVTVGDPPRSFDGYISYFGARYRFYGRSNYHFLDDAFHPEIFSNWVGGGEHPRGAITPIGFGTPMTVEQAGPENHSGSLATVIPEGPAPYERGTIGGQGRPGEPHTFTYFSRTFYLPDDFDINDIASVRGAHHIDDVLVLFINGEEVYRFNTTSTRNNVYIGRRPNTVDNWNWGVGVSTDARLRTFHIDRDYSGGDADGQSSCGANLFQAASRTNFNETLQAGQNVITAAVGNSFGGRDDLWFNLELYIQMSYPLFGELNLAIENAGLQNTDFYTDESLQIMQYALESAIEVRDNEDATQQEVDDAAEALNAAIRGLVSNGHISYFGARYRFYGRSNYDFLDNAFYPEFFLDWVGGGAIPQGAPTPIGFGTPLALGQAGEEDFSGSLATAIPTGSAPHERGTVGGRGLPGTHSFTYFSRTFNLPEDFCISNLGEVRGTHHIDNNMILFVNGQEIYRINTNTTDANATNVFIGRHISSVYGWNFNVGRSAAARRRTFHIDYDYSVRNSGYMRVNVPGNHMIDAASRTNLELALRPGENVITAVVGNVVNATNLWFDLELFIEMIPEPEITAVSLGDDEVTVSLIRPRTDGAFLLVATYYYDGGVGTMINAAQPTAIVPLDNDDMIIPIDLTGANRVKVMMWELNTLTPLSGYYEKSL